MLWAISCGPVPINDSLRQCQRRRAIVHGQTFFSFTDDLFDSYACGFRLRDHIDGLADDDRYYTRVTGGLSVRECLAH